MGGFCELEMLVGVDVGVRKKKGGCNGSNSIHNPNHLEHNSAPIRVSG